MTVFSSTSNGRSSPRRWPRLLAASALAALVIGPPDAALAQSAPGKPAVRSQDAPQVSRPTKPTRQRGGDPGDSSADELNRRYNEQLQAQARADEQARAAEEARRREAPPSRGFFGRLFGSSDTAADEPAPAPTGDQIAQTPPPSAPPSRQPVPVPPGPSAQPPTLITPPAPPPGVIPPPTPAQAPVEEAPSRRFGRSAVVPTEQPTLAVDAGKGTIVKLKAPASTVFIANPDIADVQVKTGGTIYVFGKKPGETVLYAVDEQDRVLLNTVVIVGHPMGRVLGNVAGMPGGANIQATTVGGSVVLQGRSNNPAAIEQARRMAAGVTGDPAKVINNVALDGANQVLLKVRIVEAQRESLKRLGINWESVFSLGSGITAGLATPTDLILDPVTRLGSPAGGAVFGRAAGRGYDIFGLIDLLATENMLTVLAEPNLTAMSGETASFLAGGEFPIVIPQGNNAFGVQFKQFGVSLAFTPTIHANGRISLRAKPEVSQLSTNGQVSFGGFTIPALTVRRVDTTVELASGQSLAIAGLIQNNSTQDITKLPGLGDIPVLGALFRSDSFRRAESELVVIVTPYLVRGTNKQLSTPADGYVPPTDADRYLLGRTYRRQTAGGTNARSPSPVGGFMLE